MKKISKSHKRYVDNIMKCDDTDILEHRMKGLEDVCNIETTESVFNNSIVFQFWDGKKFRAYYNRNNEKELALKKCFQEMLRYKRKVRKDEQ